MSPSHPIARRLAARLAALGLLAGAAAVPFGSQLLDGPGSSPDPTLAASSLPVPPDRPTKIKVASFNVLGYNHTEPGGSKPWYANGRDRMRMATKLIKQQRFDAFGMQELQVPQWEVFRNQLGSSYRMYPSNELGSAPMQNSIAWNYKDWYAEQKNTIAVPYFHGDKIRMPYVLLRNRETGGKVYLYNSHHAADTQGNASRWRTKAIELEAALINRLKKAHPSIPVISTGDKNATNKYICPIMQKTGIVPANGGGYSNGKCHMPTLPAHPPINWVSATSRLRWSTYQALRNATVKKITDHPVIIATGYIPDSQVTSSGVKHVVLINAQGLNSGRIRQLGSGSIPRIRSMMKNGASTLNARAPYDRVGTAPATVGELTSRPARRAIGGHGVGERTDKGGTIHKAAGHYVASVFDVLHDYNRRSGYFSSHAKTGNRVINSYDGNSGRADHYGLGNGHDKIDRTAITKADWKATKAAVTELKARPKALTYLQLGGADAAALKYGPYSAQYTKALKQIDVHIGKVMAAINQKASLRHSTVVIVTTDHGGTKAKDFGAGHRATYTIPFFVWGRGVAKGADLYALNRHYKNPGAGRPRYTADRDPIRNTYAANLVTKLLGMPPVNGSNMDSGQTMTVFRH